MTVFDLQKVCDQTISSKGLDKVFLCDIFVRKIGSEKLFQSHSPFVEIFEKGIKSSDILQHLNKAIIWPKRDNLIRKYNTVNFFFFKNVGNVINKLHGKLLLF